MEGDFLDENFALQAGISCEPLETPLDANVLNRRLLAHVAHCTELLLLLLSRNDCEQLQSPVLIPL